MTYYSYDLSTHDLTQRSTTCFAQFAGVQDLSTHDLTQRSTLYCNLWVSSGRTFNSRPHAEVDDVIGPVHSHIHAFQLTTSRRGRPCIRLQWDGNSCFQLTTSRRGRHIHPVLLMGSEELSTHDLTQRSTSTIHSHGSTSFFQLTTSRRGRQQGALIDDIVSGLSTHDLTQRST